MNQFEDLFDQCGLPTYKLQQCLKRALEQWNPAHERQAFIERTGATGGVAHDAAPAKPKRRYSCGMVPKRPKPAAALDDFDPGSVMHDVVEPTTEDLLRDALRKMNLL